MEGFLNLKLKPWIRRLITRLLAVLPAILVVFIYGETHISSLLIFSQVVLSMQLSFAVFPLIFFTSDIKKMGIFFNLPILKLTTFIIGALIATLNVWMIFFILK